MYKWVVVTQPLADASLIARARRGDGHAYGELVRRHQRIAERVAFMAGATTAELEDVVQESFVKAYRSLARFRPGAEFRPWLLAIVANEARNARRAAGRRDALALRSLIAESRSPDAAPDPVEGRVLDEERREALLGALERLGPEQRDVLTCRFLLELSEEETAAALRLRRGTVKSRAHRALERLRADLGEAGRL